MSIESNKLMNLADGKVLYDDLRGRIESPLTANITTPAAIQSFSDGAAWGMNLKVAVDPVQDLRGYANPWAGGSGKNLYYCLRAARTNQGVTFTNTDGEISVSGGVSGTNQAYYGSNSGAAESNCQLFQAGTYTISGSIDNVTLTARNLTSSLASCEGAGGSASFTLNEETYIWVQVTVAVGTSFTGEVKLYIQIESGNTATSFAPYSNICPITGWTGAQISVTGKNLFDKNADRYGLSINTTSNTYASGNGRVGLVSVKPNTTYTVSKQAGQSFRLATSKDKPAIGVSITQTIANHTGTELTITTGNEDNWLGIYGWSTTDTVTEQAMFDTVQCEFGSVKSSYEPFGATYPITFPGSAGTVYGGELTVNADGTGTLVQTHKYYEFDGSDDEDWYSEGNGTYKFARINIVPYYNRDEPALCNEFTYAIVGNNTSNIGYDFLNDNHLRVRYDLLTSLTKAEIKTYFSNHPIQVVYKLATPIIYSLSVPQVLSILGQNNNVWADCGNITELEYVRRQDLGFIREDTAGQIRAAVDPVQTELDDTQAAMAIVVDGDTAPKNITSGQYVFVKNHSTLASGMYHATEAISSGASVTSSNVAADADGAINVLLAMIQALQ